MTSSTKDRTTKRIGAGAGRASGTSSLKVGFVPLVDAAPLIAAQELGYFGDEGLHVTLERQIGWGNVRDKLTFGQLDASHALVGMPPASQLKWEWFSEPLVSLMTLATGGNGITLSKSLVDRGVTTATGLHDYIQTRSGERQRPIRLAHVFGCSAHHYLLRMWLESGGIDPNLDVVLCVAPPPQMGWHLAEGGIDGFCAGEPWNTLAQRNGGGVIVAATADLAPSHPEKILAVTKRWAADHEAAPERLVRAVLRACAYCHEPDNRAALAEMLSRKAYLALPAKYIEQALAFAGPLSPHLKRDITTSTVRRSPCFDPANAFPSATHVAWILDRMARAVDASDIDDPMAIARQCCGAAAYRRAASSLDLPCPANDFPPMPLRTGTYDPLAQRRTARNPSPPPSRPHADVRE